MNDPHRQTMMHHLSSSHATVASASSRPSSRREKIVAGFVLQEKLGSGSFASVYKGVRLEAYREAISSQQAYAAIPNDAVAAIKAISRTSRKLTKKVLENLDMEIAILRTYRHPNIVCLHDVQKTEMHFYLVLEYCGGGDLQGLIRSRRHKRLGERLCRRLVRDLSAGLGFLWGKELVHRDIKPQNLLLTGPLPPEDEVENPPSDDPPHAGQRRTAQCGDAFMLKIADFGFARHLSGVDMAETMCGSPLYMAPEVLNGEKYDVRADLWSTGVVLFEMVTGKTPFHGQTPIDLLRNIKTKAVRMPNDLRPTREFVVLLRGLLVRRPHSRADFKTFTGLSEAFVSLGCNGSPAAYDRPDIETNIHVVGQMNLCSISETEGEHSIVGSADRYTGQYSRAPHVPSVSQTAMVTSQRGGHSHSGAPLLDKQGVVTPPFAPLPAPPFARGHHGSVAQGRSSVFAPLQGSPNLAPSGPRMPSPPSLSLGEDRASARIDARSLPQPRPSRHGSYGGGGMHQQFMNQQTMIVNNQNNLFAGYRQASPRTNHDSSTEGFVMVEHSACRSRSNSSLNSPATSGAYSPSVSPHSSSGRVTILNKAQIGMLGTSPQTGRALVGRMMSGSPSKSSQAASGGRFDVSPASALKSGGCLAHIDSLAKMLAASEDIGRRAITVAHLGDTRAYSAMGLLVAQKEGSGVVSSMSTSNGPPPPPATVSQSEPLASMEDANAGKNDGTPPMSNATKTLSTTRGVTVEDEDTQREKDIEDELPFSMTSSTTGGGGSRDEKTGNVDNSEGEESQEGTPAAIQVHFREALLCYFKTMSMMKYAIGATQKVVKEIDNVTLPADPQSSRNPYLPVKDAADATLAWLRGQFSAVLERADAAGEQISDLQKISPLMMESSVCVEELIYNHSLKCGQDGAVNQLHGQYDCARSCYRSAGLLAETLLMESRLGEDDRATLEGYVTSFADQIMALDALQRVELELKHSQLRQATDSRV